jgi:hypothetical protein
MPAILKKSLPNLLASYSNILPYASIEVSMGSEPRVRPPTGTLSTVDAGSDLEHYAVSIVGLLIEGTHCFAPPISDAGVVCSLAGCIV